MTLKSIDNTQIINMPDHDINVNVSPKLNFINTFNETLNCLLAFFSKL